ncbi:hypothetical protein Q4485_00390 [Granulosicoccaceae sp. 1_MG-2023]|nr:hypothetical protein [Granulosicoccaceae sp. 1_MG-2023]
MTHAQIAREAVALVRPAIDKLLEQAVRQEMHIVIMDPRIMPWEADFSEAVLYEESIRSGKPWEKPFDEFARNKAAQAWRRRQPNAVVQTLHPSSLRDGDLPFYGSFVYGDVVVGCSGVEQWFDSLVSGWIALSFEQLMIHQRQQQS